MPETLPDSIEPYTNISPKAYEHPADRAATAALKAVPMLDAVVRRLIEWRYERALRQLFLSNSVKVGESQLPDLWAAHTGMCRVLDMPEVYDLYVTWSVPGLAQAIGSTKPMVVFDSMLLERLGPGEQRVVLAHELGHILSDHMVYVTALNILLSVGNGLPFLLGVPFRAVKAVLLEWFRAAELSCDRAATIAVRDPQIVCRALMVFAGGMSADKLNLDAFMTQAMEYESWDDPSDRVRRFFNEIGQTHPYAVRRVSEVMRWVQSGDYDRIIRGEYITRDQRTDVREEAGDAMEFYAERFRTIFREAGRQHHHPRVPVRRHGRAGRRLDPDPRWRFRARRLRRLSRGRTARFARARRHRRKKTRRLPLSYRWTDCPPLTPWFSTMFSGTIDAQVPSWPRALQRGRKGSTMPSFRAWQSAATAARSPSSMTVTSSAYTASACGCSARHTTPPMQPRRPSSDCSAACPHSRAASSTSSPTSSPPPGMPATT